MAVDAVPINNTPNYLVLLINKLLFASVDFFHKFFSVALISSLYMVKPVYSI